MLRIHCGSGRWWMFAAVLACSILNAGCDNANVSYGVGISGGSYGWGSSFSVGISNHHYRGYRRGP